MRRVLFSIFIINLVSANEFVITDGEVTYFGEHYLHEWRGVSTSINGSFYLSELNNTYHCSISIPLNSFSSGNSNRDSNMLIYCRGIDFPIIRFTADSITLVDNIADIAGNLVFAGKTNKLKTKVNLIPQNDSVISVVGEFEFLLSKFDIERPSLMFGRISDTILIKFILTGSKNE